MNKFITYYKSPISDILLSSDGENITGLLLSKQRFPIDTSCTVQKDNLPLFKITKKWLDSYFMGENPNAADIPISAEGTPFKKRVWNEVYKIPYGKTAAYSDIANSISNKMSAQAIGNALAHNPILILIPCHRVIGKNGKLTGFSAGENIKLKLLELEGVNIGEFS